jgi:hypothetical protein
VPHGAASAFHVTVFSPLVERNHLAVDDGLWRQARESAKHAAVSAAEVVVVAGAEMDLAARLERNGSIAIQLELIFPVSASAGNVSARKSSMGLMNDALPRIR